MKLYIYFSTAVGNYPLQNVTKGLTTEGQCLISWSVEGFSCAVVLLTFNISVLPHVLKRLCIAQVITVNENVIIT